MDFGMDGLVAASSEAAAAAPATSFFFLPSEAESKGQKGSFGFFKDENEWRRLKMARTAGTLPSAATAAASGGGKEAPFFRPTSSLFPDGEQMLSFSKHGGGLSSISSDAAVLPFYGHHTSSSLSSSSLCGAAAGFGSSGSSSMGGAGGVHGVLGGVRSLFTPTQWMEFEHQALIYKYIDSNAPIPSNLLLPSSRRPTMPHFLASGSARSPATTTTLGWGPFVGFSGSADPEPGRCRRTDGKKWRCSRDAASDGKYCERHMNRGRHRSRKHVEGQNGHAMKAMPPAPSSAAVAIPGRETTNNLSGAQQPKHLTPIAAGPPRFLQFNRITMSKDGANDDVFDSQVLSALPSANSNTLFSNLKRHNPFDGLSLQAETGCTRADDSFLARSTKPYSENISFGSPSHSQTHPLLPFFDDWPKGDHRSEGLDTLQLEKTQLSISIPMASTDFSSSSSSPVRKNPTLSPLKLYREFAPAKMALGVHPGQASWAPVPWETSLGGPLGEVLTSTNNILRDGGTMPRSSSSLNLLTDGWDSSPRLGSSPTGVLQNTTFASLSSSTGSSPRAVENQEPNICNASRLHDNADIGSPIGNPSTVPSL